MSEGQNMYNNHSMKCGARTVVFFSDFAAGMGLRCVLKNISPSRPLLFNHDCHENYGDYFRGSDDNVSTIETQQYTMPVYEFINYLFNINKIYPSNEVVFFIESHDRTILKLLASLKIFYLLSKRESKQFIYHAVTDSISIFNQYASPEIINSIGDRNLNKYLTNRQWFVLNQLAKNHTPNVVGQILGLHVKTISTHKRNIMKKLGFSSLQFLQLLMLLGEVKEISTMVITPPSYQYVKSGHALGNELSEIES